MTRIPAQLARRLDRLSVAAHRFHRWAHHPLCAEYEGEVLRFGRTRLCRGCAMAAAGGASGLASAWALPPLALPWLGLLALLGLPMALWLGLGRAPSAAAPEEGTPEAEALTRSHRLPPRRGKVLTRFLPCALAAFGLAQGLRSGGRSLGLSAFIALQVLAVVLAYRRRGPQRGPCATCPERFAMHRCRGVREVLRRERAFQRLAGKLIAEATTSAGPRMEDRL